MNVSFMAVSSIISADRHELETEAQREQKSQHMSNIDPLPNQALGRLQTEDRLKPEPERWTPANRNRIDRRRCGTWFLLLALAAFVISRTAGGVIDLDLFHEMALAREAIQRGFVPWTDSFAYTPTVDIVVHHEWGLGLIALLIARTAGGSGIILLKFLLIFGLAFVVWTTARARHARPVIIGLLMALAIVLSDFGFATVRAQMFSYLFAALLLRGFDRDRSGDRRWLIGVIMLFPVWANIHGGCLVGAALFAMHWMEQLIKRQPHWHLFLMGLCLIPLAAINPWHFHFHQYLIHAMLMPRPAIAEWSSLLDAENRLQLVNFGMSLLPLILILKQTNWRRLPGLLIVLATGMAALKSNRFLPFYAVAYASYLPSAFSTTIIGRDLRRWWWRCQPACCTCLGLAAIALLWKSLPSEPWRLRVASHPLPHQGQHLIYPVGAVDHLANNGFVGNVMVPYDWGSYVMWKLGPNVKVSFDSRYEVAYPTWRMEEDDRFYDALDGWPEVLSKYPADVVLVRSDLKIVKPLDVDPGWHRIYTDPQFVMFARTGIDVPIVKFAVPAPDGLFP